MKDIMVSFRRDLTINTGDFSNAKVGAPFPTAVCEEGEDPVEAYQKLKAMNLEVMRVEIVELTAELPTYLRHKALAMIGIVEAKPVPTREDDGDEEEDHDDYDADDDDGDDGFWDGEGNDDEETIYPDDEE